MSGERASQVSRSKEETSQSQGLGEREGCGFGNYRLDTS